MAAITAEQALKRAQRWVDLGVPYSQPASSLGETPVG